MEEENQQNSFGFVRALLKLGYYATFVCQAIMVILWISSIFSHDTSFFLKMNFVTGILIFILNTIVLKNGWDKVGGSNGFNTLYIFTGILMALNVFCLPVAVVYIAVPVFMRYKEKKANSIYNKDNF
ncbi:hypothetical protein ACYSNU_07155 [Enterococcus sp. LJL120]